jgi:RNA-binding protein
VIALVTCPKLTNNYRSFQLIRNGKLYGYDPGMSVLTSKQRQYLRGLAHPLAPVVRVGKGGVTPALIAETKKSLESHELIKVRIDVDDAEERRAIAQKLASETESYVAGTIGKVAILYRADDDEPTIKLPR